MDSKIGIKVTISYTELKPKTAKKNKSLIASEPFPVVRNPSWDPHLNPHRPISDYRHNDGRMITLIDLSITYFVTIELKDRKLTERFGSQCREYTEKVPKFFPKLRSKTTMQPQEKTRAT
jgi:hypothetical protein